MIYLNYVMSQYLKMLLFTNLTLTGAKCGPQLKMTYLHKNVNK